MKAAALVFLTASVLGQAQTDKSSELTERVARMARSDRGPAELLARRPMAQRDRERQRVPAGLCHPLEGRVATDDHRGGPVTAPSGLPRPAATRSPSPSPLAVD